jgi:RNA polymerase sigma factor (sigma-70 family)
VLLNVWRDEARRSSRWRAAAEFDDRHPTSAEPDVVEQLSQLEMLRRLPPRRRAAIVLRFYSDLSISETAAALGCSEGTVKSLTSRGLQSLREFAALAERTDQPT